MISTAAVILAVSTVTAVVSAPTAVVLETPETFVPMKALHLTAWVAGTRRLRRKFLAKASATVVNAIVVPVKETDGRVYIPGVASAVRWGTQRVAIPRPAELVQDIHDLGMLAVARIVLFQDNKLPRKKPEWGIQDVDGGLWENRKKKTWANPYHRDVWEYNLEIASKAISYGFDEIQFDYIRYPSEGKTDRCRYPGINHSSTTAVANLVAFLTEAKSRFEKNDVPVSAAIFGLVVSARNDLGIGQNLDAFSNVLDAISPMMYPSHYIRGTYGIKHPNASPYKVIDVGLRDATRRLKKQSYKLRPYLQDFSLGVRYREKEVRAQMKAAISRGVHSWILWNPQNRYTWDALVEESPEAAITPPPGILQPAGDVVDRPTVQRLDSPLDGEGSDGASFDLDTGISSSSADSQQENADEKAHAPL
ncbi:MAG: hypothetical protein COB53_07180 [Elusimicrobia bacterium]|nr:MAG: hypothetical protein COB53_07180 [Elusimicrobiota bacterium]